MYWYHGAGWAGLVMTLIMLAFWGLLAYLFVLAIRGSRLTGGSPPSDARSVLDARLARGEIDSQEYREHVAALSEVRHA